MPVMAKQGIVTQQVACTIDFCCFGDQFELINSRHAGQDLLNSLWFTLKELIILQQGELGSGNKCKKGQKTGI
jgi:hypothetical protein